MLNLEVMRNTAICLMFAMTFGLAALEKWKSLQTPEWFIDQFKNTFLGPFPNVIAMSYWFIATSEALMAIAFLASIFIKDYLKLNLIGAMFLFFILGSGLRIARDYQGAANLFIYFGVALLSFYVVSQ